MVPPFTRVDEDAVYHPPRPLTPVVLILRNVLSGLESIAARSLLELLRAVLGLGSRYGMVWHGMAVVKLLTNILYKNLR